MRIATVGRQVMVVSSSLEMVWLARCSGSRTCLLRSASTRAFGVRFVCLFRTSVARERCAQSTKAVCIGTDELASNVQLVDVSALHFSEVLAVVQASHAV